MGVITSARALGSFIACRYSRGAGTKTKQIVLKNDNAVKCGCWFGAFSFTFFMKKHFLISGVLELISGRAGHINYCTSMFPY